MKKKEFWETQNNDYQTIYEFDVEVGFLYIFWYRNKIIQRLRLWEKIPASHWVNEFLRTVFLVHIMSGTLRLFRSKNGLSSIYWTIKVTLCIQSLSDFSETTFLFFSPFWDFYSILSDPHIVILVYELICVPIV